MLKNQIKLEQSYNIRYKSFLIANELRQSSDDLTRYCRTYVLTGDSVWEKKYWEVLDIRNGIKPRPDGRTIALQDSMNKLGFTKAEFGKLKEAEDNSNDLVWTETVAFHAMKGLFDDGTGKFTVKNAPDTELARNIMFNEKYHADKAKIMNPIDDFFILLDQRTYITAKRFDNKSYWLLGAIIGLIVLISTISIISFFIIKNKIIKQLDELKKAKERIEKSEAELKIQNEELDKIVEKRTKEIIKQNKEYASLNEEFKIRNEELIKSKEKAEESDRLKREFLNNMSHEIRTPMNGILGFSNLLNASDLTNEKRNYFNNIIQNSCNQLLRIVDDILEISELETKQVRVSENEVCLNDLLLELFSIFDIKAKESKIPLYLKKGLSDKDSAIITDKTKLNKMLSNLLENALKFTSEGFIELGYTVVNNEIEIYVKDTGIGINTDKQEIIFERFSQENEDTAPNYGGLGLGLSITKENTRLLGGRISVKSEKRKGSTFFVTIPYKQSISNTEITSQSTIANQKSVVGEYTILIVEDDEFNFLYLEALIEKFDFTHIILHVKNGKEAVEACKTNSQIDFVLMDIKIPIMDGYETTKQIKEFRPELPIIAQTAYSTTAERNKATSAGCDDFISKPISKEVLISMIDKYLITKQTS